MDTHFKQFFIDHWTTYFGTSELPIVFSYTNQPEKAHDNKGPHCLICDLQQVRRGDTRSYSGSTMQCPGAKRYAGFAQGIHPDFNHFLSCGIPRRVRGERYKKSPGIVAQVMQHMPPFEAPGNTLIFKRWDMLEQHDDPIAVIFFARPDVLAGLFTLANFDRPDLLGVIAPFCSGCGSIIYFPYHESRHDSPRAVQGMYDISARPCVKPDELTFSIPFQRFREMVANMDESFLITESWEKLRKRI